MSPIARSVQRFLLAVGAGFVWLFAANQSVATLDVDERLAAADALRRSDHVRFVAELDALEALSEISPEQREQIAYLRAWQATYQGDYDLAIRKLESLISSATSELVRFRSRSTIINALGLVRRYNESFEHLNLLLEELPVQTDPRSRAQALAVAAQLHNSVGQHEDSLRFTSQLLTEAEVPWVRCGALGVQTDSGVKSGRLADVTDELRGFIDECQRNNEFMFSGGMRVMAAKLHLRNSRPLAALEMIRPHEAEIRSTQYPRLIADMAVQMARAYLLMGNFDAAERRAQQAIDITRPGENTEPLAEGWKILAEVASQRGDHAAAFQALQRHAEVDRANLDDIGQRALAFQLARFRTQAQKLEIESLNQQNELLKLQQEVSTSAVQNARLSILLLLVVLGFGLVWFWRTRQMKQHFQRLAQSDSLTGAASRPHFMATARQQLERAERQGQPAALVIMDLDFFKSVNDEHGHAMGDRILVEAAAACLHGPARQALFGRLGGEEFGLLLVGMDAAAGLQVAEQCRLAIHQIVYGPEGRSSRLSASFGVADSSGHGYELRELLIAADAALYEAKRKGRNRVIHLGRRSHDGSAAPVLSVEQQAAARQ